MNDATPQPEFPSPSPTARAVRPNPWILVAIAALGLAGWQWVENRNHLAETRQEIAKQLADSSAAAQADRTRLVQLQEQMQGLQAKLATLETRQAEFQNQSQELQGLFQDLSRNRDDLALLEVEQALTLAAQQLQLAGNVPAAVLALQTADAKLARIERPQLLPLRKTLNRDLERLKALPVVDLPGMSMKLEGVVVNIDKLPLAMNERPKTQESAAQPASGAADTAWWRRAGDEFLKELKGLVRIQRMDRAEPALLSPDQNFFLRENLKLRLLNARLALFGRDAWTFRNELRTAQEWLGRHFDGQDKTVQTAMANLRQLGAAELNIEVPNLNDSLAALRAVKGSKDRK